MLAVMHSHDFGSAEQLAAYLGLVPVERQSGSSVLGRASWCICVSALSKLDSHTSTIMRKSLDAEDGIYKKQSAMT